MKHKKNFFLIMFLVVALDKVSLPNIYSTVWAEENTDIRNTAPDVYIDSTITKSEYLEGSSVLFNNNENLFKNRETDVVNYTWDGVKCSFNTRTGELNVGEGEIRPEYMLEKSPFRNSSLYPHQPEDIQTINFDGKLKLNGSATNFFTMLKNCTQISGLDKLDTMNVTDMSYMFSGLNLSSGIDISNWDTSNVTTMEGMFAKCGDVNAGAVGSTAIKLSSGSLNPNLTNIEGMFLATYFYTGSDSGVEYDIGKQFQEFDTSSVENMNELFKEASNVNELNLTKLSMGKVTKVNMMFDQTDITKLYLPTSKPENLTNMNGMFEGLMVTELSLLGWNTKNVVSMADLFSRSELINPPIQNFDMSSVTDSSRMFAEMKNLENLNFGEGFNTQNIKNMSEMFAAINYKDLDLSFFDTTSVTNIDAMFQGSKIDSLNLSGWSNPTLESMDSTFAGAVDDRGYIKSIDLTGFNTSHVTDMSFLFYYSEKIDNFDFSSLDVSSVESMAGMFRGSSFDEFDFSTWDTRQVTDMSEMFAGDIGRDKLPVPMNIKSLDLRELNTEGLEDSYRMFANLTELEDLNLGSFSSLDSVDTQDMFINCSGLAKLELSKEINKLPDDINLPEVESSSKHPTSWISEKSDVFYETTELFVSNYEYTLNNGLNEVLIRSFKYKVQYVIENEMKLEDEYLYNQSVEIPVYFNNRYEVSSWLNSDTNIHYIPKSQESNIGVKKDSFEETIRLSGDFSEREVDLKMYWQESNNDLLESAIDIGEDSLDQSIITSPSLLFNQTPTASERFVSYKIETYDCSNQNKILVQTTYETFEINETTDSPYELILENFQEGRSSIEIEFYQLSVIGDEIETKEPIKEEPSGKLSIHLIKDRSFSIVDHTEILQWQIRTSDSKGILSRKGGNDLSFLILNSLNPEEQWDISLSMEYPDSLPFDFIWKNTKEDEGVKIERRNPITILNKNEAESVNAFKYQKSWGEDAGILIRSNSILSSENYSKDIKINWILSSNPTFE